MSGILLATHAHCDRTKKKFWHQQKQYLCLRAQHGKQLPVWSKSLFCMCFGFKPVKELACKLLHRTHGTETANLWPNIGLWLHEGFPEAHLCSGWNADLLQLLSASCPAKWINQRALFPLWFFDLFLYMEGMWNLFQHWPRREQHPYFHLVCLRQAVRCARALCVLRGSALTYR